jgi:hypothetical protein
VAWVGNDPTCADFGQENQNCTEIMILNSFHKKDFHLNISNEILYGN